MRSMRVGVLVLMAVPAQAQLSETDGPQTDAPLACSRLADLRVEDTNLLSSVLVPASEDLPAYCRVLGYVRPAINFELRLPATDWNGRFYMAGCGALCGRVDSARPPTSSDNNLNHGLARGYAAVSMDSGHWGTSVTDGRWALHDRVAEVDWAYRAVHEVARVSKELIGLHYGEAVRRSYYDGCSNGGRQGLMAAARYPEDFDAILSAAPARDASREAMYDTWVAQANTGPDGSPILTAEAAAIVAAAVYRACDALDGLADGLIDDPRRCPFDPSSLACGEDASEDCLTAAQVRVLEAWYAGPSNSSGATLARGVVPGSEPFWGVWLTGLSPTQPGFLVPLARSYLRYFVFREDPGEAYDIADFDFERDPPRLEHMREILAARDADLNAFREGGGKLLLYHGWADAAVPPQETLDYYEAVVGHGGGREASRDFVRLFMIPGWDHCGLQPGPGVDLAGLDALTALEQWVEEGRAPDSLLTTRRGEDGEVEWTRPVCAYPQVARYDGVGDVSKASSFQCVTAPDDAAAWNEGGPERQSLTGKTSSTTR